MVSQVIVNIIWEFSFRCLIVALFREESGSVLYLSLR